MDEYGREIFDEDDDDNTYIIYDGRKMTREEKEFEMARMIGEYEMMHMHTLQKLDNMDCFANLLLGKKPIEEVEEFDIMDYVLIG